MQHVERTLPEQFIFGPFFLVPFFGAVAVLLLEMSLVVRSRGLQRVALIIPAALVLLASFGYRSDGLFQAFLGLFLRRLGATPLYLTAVSAAGFYGYAALRRVPSAVGALTAALAALALIGPGTLTLDHCGSPRPWPILAVAALQLGVGFTRRDRWNCLVGSACLVAAASFGMEGTGLAPYRAPIVFHTSVAVLLLHGALLKDNLGRALRTAGSLLALFAALVVLAGRGVVGDSVPAWALAAYPVLVAAGLSGYGLLLGERLPRAAAALVLVGWLVARGWRLYELLRQAVPGLDFISAGLSTTPRSTARSRMSWRIASGSCSGWRTSATSTWPPRCKRKWPWLH
jgi:hypothetical protein